MLPEVVSLSGLPVPKSWKIAAATITRGMLLILDNSGGGIGQAKEFLSSNGAFNSSNIEGGLLGVAENDAAANEVVHYAMLVGYTRLKMLSYGAVPSQTVLGVAPTTYYVLQRDSAIAKIDLATTASGVARLDGLVPDPNEGFSSVRDSAGGSIPVLSGYAVGDPVFVAIPEAFRHHK